MPFIKSSSLINLVYSYKANQTRFECSALFSLSYQRALFFRFLSLPPSEYPSYNNIISTNGKQVDVLKRPEANTDFIYFSALSYYKSSVEQISLYLLSHSRIRIIVLTCPNNNVLLQVCKKSSPEIMRACKIIQITMMRGQNLGSLSVCSCSCEDSREPPLNLYWDISIAEDLCCLKTVDRNFVRNGLEGTYNNTDAFVALQLGRCIRTNR